MTKIPEWLKVGAKVDYHSIIGGEVTKAGLTVTHIGPTNSTPKQPDRVWLDGHSGCVSIDALTLAAE